MNDQPMLRQPSRWEPGCGSSPAASWAGAAGLAIVLIWIVHQVWAGLFIPWWFNTDEVAFYSEIIRQLHFDFSQTFFDIPGTPYMVLTSSLTYLWWAAAHLLGMSASANASDFAFANAQNIHTLMRGLTLAMYVLAVSLTYDVFRRAAHPVTAAVAAILMATLPIHVHYSHFVRTESLGLVLTLLSVRLMLCPRTSRRWRTYLLAGALAGVAAAARFHFALVSLPVLLALYFFEDRPVLDLGGLAPPRRTLYVLAALLGALFIGGGVVTLLLRHQLLLPNRLTQAMLLSTAGGAAEYSAAKQLMAAVWLLLAGVAVTIFIPQCFSAGRRSLRPIVNAYTMCLVLGFSGGFLLAHPTFLWRGEHQLRSIQFYSEWVNPDLLTLAPLWAWWRVTAGYFDLALPEFWLKPLFLVGIVFLLWRRHAVHAAFLVAALACFVSHPVTMKLWPHHVIPWLPFLSFVAAYPIGYLAFEVTRRVRRPALSVALLLAVMASLLWALSPRLAKADEYLKVSTARTKQIAEMSEWIAEHVPEGSLLMLSYYSLNRDGFFKLIENAGIPIPDDVKRRRDLRIWWLDRNALTGREGYVCVSRADIALFRDDFERRQPGSTYNPFEDRRFEPLALFGGGFYELQVFKFDFRSARTAG